MLQLKITNKGGLNGGVFVVGTTDVVKDATSWIDDDLQVSRNGKRAENINDYKIIHDNYYNFDNNNSDYDVRKDYDTGKDLSSRTIKAVRWLHSTGRLSSKKKNAIVADIISNVGLAKLSKAEVAFSLLICRGRPGVDIITIPDVSYDVADLNMEDMTEFKDICHEIF